MTNSSPTDAPQRCLVTGGAGFIGSNLALALEALGHQVTVADDFSTGHRDHLKKLRGRVLDVDVSRRCDFGETYDVIFHQAAITDPRHPDDDATWRINVDSFDLLVDLARDQGARLVYASTAGVYGNGPSPQREDQDKELFSVYGKSKLHTDEVAAGRWDRQPIIGLRYFNVFGPHEAKKGRAASMIYHLARQIASGKRPRLFTDGSQKRDHIYVKDCVRANLLAMTAPSGVYNVGTGIGTSFNELVFHIGKALGVTPDIDYIDNPYTGTYQDDTCADPTLARERLGFTAVHDVATAIPEYVAFLRETGEL
jgi:ADP-L-glycero-D-manno-heptose 6-epimerase